MVRAGAVRADIARPFGPEPASEAAIFLDDRAVVLEDRGLPAGSAPEGLVIPRADHAPARLVRFDLSGRFSSIVIRVGRLHEEAALRISAEVDVNAQGRLWQAASSR